MFSSHTVICHLWMGGNALVVAGDELDARFLLEDRFKERFKGKELKNMEG